jgi:branched-chain amino acid transport system permease protein
MRFIFKTSYAQDINIVKHKGQSFWYSFLLLTLALCPLIVSEFWMAQINIILIYSLVGFGTMILLGFTGQLSFGHAAFFGLGAFVQAFFTNLGWPFFAALTLSILINVILGALIALPALRVKGIFLGVATLALGLIVEEVFVKWESFTNGTSGLAVKPAQILGVIFNTQISFFYLVLCMWWWQPC